MQSEFTINDHWLSPYKKPAGGCTCGQGFTISWQNGPLGKGEDRREPNGPFCQEIVKTCWWLHMWSGFHYLLAERTTR